MNPNSHVRSGQDRVQFDKRTNVAPDPREESRSTVDSRQWYDDPNISEAQLQGFLRSEFSQTVLPAPPALPGFHQTYLPIDSKSMSIEDYMKVGYRLVTKEDHPNWRVSTMETGAYAGGFQIKEMLLFKVPLRIWEQIMKINHDLEPASREMGIKQHARAGEGRLRGKMVTEADPDTDGFATDPRMKTRAVFRD